MKYLTVVMAVLVVAILGTGAMAFDDSWVGYGTVRTFDDVEIGASIGATPGAKLEVNGALLVTGSGTDYAPINGAGARFMYAPAHAAFRSGYASGTEWDNHKLGAYSGAVGAFVEATGTASFCTGWFNNARGFASTAMGVGSNATGYGSTALGQGQASGFMSTAMGNSTIANSFVSTALGQFNIGGGTDVIWVATDPLFEIGMGADAAHRANALTVLKNGNVGIGTGPLGPTEKLEVVGTIKADYFVGDGSLLENLPVYNDTVIRADVDYLLDAVDGTVAITGILDRLDAIEAALSKPGASGDARWGK